MNHDPVGVGDVREKFSFCGKPGLAPLDSAEKITSRLTFSRVLVIIMMTSYDDIIMMTSYDDFSEIFGDFQLFFTPSWWVFLTRNIPKKCSKYHFLPLQQ